MQNTNFKKRKPSQSRRRSGGEQSSGNKRRSYGERNEFRSNRSRPDRDNSERGERKPKNHRKPHRGQDNARGERSFDRPERDRQVPDWALAKQARRKSSRTEETPVEGERNEKFQQKKSRPSRDRYEDQRPRQEREKFTRDRFGKNKKRRNDRSRKSSGRDLSKYIHTPGESKEKAAVYEPNHSFEDFHVNQELLQRIKQKGFKAPSEIQDKAIPVLLQGDDLIGIAGTGTGKTAAFLIPIIDRLLEEPEDQSALIIAPTRELASQINDEFRSLVKGLGIYSTCLIGGLSVRDSIQALKRTNHIIIGTPGRLLDMHDRGLLDLENFETLVLDEFDRMLDMGFSDEMQMINKEMVNKEQTMLFSATVDPSQRKLIDEIAGAAEEVQAAMNTQKTDAIHQDVLRVNGQDKFQLMLDLIVEQDEEKVILFCETKRNADEMLKKLKNEGVRADAIHGDKTQNARQTALRKFKKGNINVLIATDVVARGIDVPDVSLVINYEIPRNYTDYVHRIGRTGRAGKTGRAVTMVN
ncbi:MAG: DEAD/DEAH box helicase [Cytophagales bacterium]|nr:DEAD/DEAH box helicase [Cytophagales bacterium]